MVNLILKRVGFVVLFNVGTMMIVSQLIMFNNLGHLEVIYGGCFVISIALSMLIPAPAASARADEGNEKNT